MAVTMEGRRAFSVPVQLNDVYHPQLGAKLNVLQAVIARELHRAPAATCGASRADSDSDRAGSSASESSARGAAALSMRVPRTPTTRTASCPLFETQLAASLAQMCVNADRRRPNLDHARKPCDASDLSTVAGVSCAPILEARQPQLAASGRYHVLGAKRFTEGGAPRGQSDAPVGLDCARNKSNTPSRQRSHDYLVHLQSAARSKRRHHSTGSAGAVSAPASGMAPPRITQSATVSATMLLDGNDGSFWFGAPLSLGVAAHAAASTAAATSAGAVAQLRQRDSAPLTPTLVAAAATASAARADGHFAASRPAVPRGELDVANLTSSEASPLRGFGGARCSGGSEVGSGAGEETGGESIDMCASPPRLAEAQPLPLFGAGTHAPSVRAGSESGAGRSRVWFGADHVVAVSDEATSPVGSLKLAGMPSPVVQAPSSASLCGPGCAGSCEMEVDDVAHAGIMVQSAAGADGHRHAASDASLGDTCRAEEGARLLQLHDGAVYSSRCGQQQQQTSLRPFLSPETDAAEPAAAPKRSAVGAAGVALDFSAQSGMASTAVVAAKAQPALTPHAAVLAAEAQAALEALAETFRVAAVATARAWEAANEAAVAKARARGLASAAVPTSIQWRGEATEVSVVGSFSGWAERIPLLSGRDSSDWYVTLGLPPGEHAFRFVVDGEWRCSPDNAMALDGSGSVHNVITVLHQSDKEELERSGVAARLREAERLSCARDECVLGGGEEEGDGWSQVPWQGLSARNPLELPPHLKLASVSPLLAISVVSAPPPATAAAASQQPLPRDAAGPPALHTQLSHLFCTAPDCEVVGFDARPPPLEVCMGVRYTPRSAPLDGKTVTLILLKPAPRSERWGGAFRPGRGR